MKYSQPAWLNQVDAQHISSGTQTRKFWYPDPKVLVPRPESTDNHSRNEIIVQVLLVPIAFAQSTKEGLCIA